MSEFEQSSDELSNSYEISNITEEEVAVETELNSQNLDKKLGFKWYKNSCAFDSFITIFIFSIYPKLLNEKSQIESKVFTYYLKFIENIIANNLNKEIKFYEIYEEFFGNEIFNFFS